MIICEWNSITFLTTSRLLQIHLDGRIGFIVALFGQSGERSQRNVGQATSRAMGGATGAQMF
jgi:hypothetical protein